MQEIPLDYKCGRKYRSEFYRLVTDAVDVAAGPTDSAGRSRNILCELGETVKVEYERDAGCKVERTMRIGRPRTENNNWDTTQSRHDVREIKLAFKVFSQVGTTALSAAVDAVVTTIPVTNAADAHPTGSILIGSEVIEYTGVNAASGGGWEFTGCTRGAEGTTAAAHMNPNPVLYSRRTGSITQAELDDDIARIDERMAQSTIRIKRPISIDFGPNSYGYPCPGLWLRGSAAFDAEPVFIPNPPTDFYSAAIPFTSGDADAVSLLYLGVGTGIGSLAQAFPAVRNQSGNSALSNWVAVDSVASRTDQFTMPHELMHILLDAPHRRGEPTTALFYETSTGPGVTGTKRIGPYPDAASAGVGNDDTHTIRNVTENLP